jgi:phage terminase large subunit-like protein
MSSPYYFDKNLADAAIEFFPRYLTNVSGEWAGKTFHLAEWEAFHTGQIFGWRRRSDGTRRYRRVRGWVPKKNGKTEWFAGMGHILTIGDNEPMAEVYCYATDKSQAEILWNKAASMISLSPELGKEYETTKTSLFCPKLMSALKPLSGDPTGKHGYSPHASLGDEAHEWSDGTLHRFLANGMAARRQPLDAIISTAGKIRTYAHELYLDSLAIRDDPELDPECYVLIYAADPEDDWTSPDVWKKANPNFGISPKREFLETECRLAQRNPRLENDFKRYHLNLWVEQQKRWLSMLRWGANTADPADAELWRKLPELMRGRRCFGGLDLASTEDITANVWVFPPEKPGDRTVLIPRFWVPEQTVAERDAPRTPYALWVREKALLTTPGNVTDYSFIEKSVMDDAKMFRLVAENDKPALAIDRWNATQVAVNLGNEGVPLAMFGQGYASMGAPTKEMERRFIAGEFEHGNHPVLKWMFGNAAVRRDPAGNLKPDKERAGEKIDGLVAAIMGLGLLIAHSPSESLDDFLASAVMR